MADGELKEMQEQNVLLKSKVEELQKQNRELASDNRKVRCESNEILANYHTVLEMIHPEAKAQIEAMDYDRYARENKEQMERKESDRCGACLRNCLH